MEIEGDLARSLQKIEDDTEGFVAPQWLRFNKFISFAIDNIDFNEATCKNSLHGTGLCVFQAQCDDNLGDDRLHFERTKKMKASSGLPYTLLKCNDPIPTAKIYDVDMDSMKSSNYLKELEHTRLWMMTFIDVNFYFVYYCG